MNFLVEIGLCLCILLLVYKIYVFKNKQSGLHSLELENQKLKTHLDQNRINVNSLNLENENLKNYLSQKENEFLSREKNLSDTIQSLQSSLTKEQELIQERKQELDIKEEKLLLNLSDLEKKLEEETENRKKVLSQKKSSEVRLGSIAETLAPFLDQFDFDPENCTFLGKPIDYISFGDDEITFIEVKSGKSQLNSKQRYIRDQVKSKLISWKEIRIE